MNGLLTRIRTRRRAQVALLLAAAAGLAVLANTLHVNLAASQTLVLESVPVADDPGLDPTADAWSQTKPIDVPLTQQNIAYPFGGGSVNRATLRALNTQDTLYIRMDWVDGTRDDRLATLTDFTDAAAIEFPVLGTVTTPSYCMGQANSAVNIWQWRAVLEGEGLPAWRDNHPNGYVDVDPWSLAEPDNPDIAYPARYVNNPISGAAGAPVLDLVAEAFGTLSPTERQLATGRGVHENGQWSVVFQRDLNVEAADEAALGGGTQTDMAVAVWNGSEGDRNGQKSVSQFVKLSIPATMVVPGRTTAADYLLTFGVPALALAGAAAVVRWMIIGRQ